MKSLPVASAEAEQLGKIRRVQLEVRELGVARAREHAAGLLIGAGHVGGQTGERVLLHGGLELFRRHASAAGEKPVAGYIGARGLHQRLYIVVVVLQPEDVHHLRLRGHARELGKDLRSCAW